jgi:hypothetical protein
MRSVNKQRIHKMSKMIKLYRLNSEQAKTMNLGHFNRTCKAILKAMYRIEKENKEVDGFPGSTGEKILMDAVKWGLWTTTQTPDKYHTTWAYYAKLLREKAHVYESGSLSKSGSSEEYLDAEEYLDDQEDAEDEDAELERMIAEENESDDSRRTAMFEDKRQAEAEEAIQMAAE